MGPVEVNGNAGYMFGGIYMSGQENTHSPVTLLNQEMERTQFVIKQARSKEDGALPDMSLCSFNAVSLLAERPFFLEY